MTPTVASGGGEAAAASTLAPDVVLRQIELLAPQARPYDLDDRFDCWGFMRALYGRLLGGDPLQEDLDAATADRAVRPRLWPPISDMGELLPGDVVTTHDHHEPGKFHVVIVYGRIGERLLVYDSSPRGDIPLFEERDGEFVQVAARELRTRFMRATGGTDRLWNEGGAYLRSWFAGGRYYDRWLHERLLEANPGRETDAVALRRRAGLAPLPFYNLRRLPRDRRRRELYDNTATRLQNAYLPDRAPVLDDDYVRVVLEGGEAGRRPAPPVLVAAPAAAHPGGPATIAWSSDDGTGSLAGWRVEANLLRRGVWKDPLLATDLPPGETSITLAAEQLVEDMAYEVSVFARDANGFSPDAVAAFVNKPAPDNPFLATGLVRARGLRPDGGIEIATVTPVLSWSILDPGVNQTALKLAIHEGGCIDAGAKLVHEVELEGETAAGTAYAVPAAAGLRLGRAYHWYLTTRDVEGRWAYAPVEGVFTVARDAVAPGAAAPHAAASGAASGAAPPPPRRDPRFRPRAGAAPADHDPV